MDKKLKRRLDKILFIFDKKWFNKKRGRYYNIPAKKYIINNNRLYYRRLKIEVFLGIKYFDPTSRKRFKSVKALENLKYQFYICSQPPPLYKELGILTMHFSF